LDPRNYEGYGDFDFVPTKLIQTAYLETASDDWFVDFDEDGLPEMAVGRIPVRTEEEAQNIVSKIVAYEQKGANQSEVLLVADIGDTYNFEGANKRLEGLLPPDLKVAEVFRDRFPSDDQVHGALIAALNRGPLLAHYSGHGSMQIWRGDVFTTDDVPSLTNARDLSFFAHMTCLNGFFHDPYPIDTLADALLKAPQGGAVAVWASSGLTEPDGQTLMNQELIRLLFSGEGLTLGQAAMRAKAATGDMDVRRTWILFGDPTTKLKR
jgi:hypothetical protein